MTDDDRIKLMQLHGQLLARIQPLQESLKPLNAQLNAITGLILADLKREYVYRTIQFGCDSAAVIEEKT